MAKMSIVFKGFDDLITQIDRAGGDMRQAVDEALEKTQEYIASNVESAAAVYASGGRKGYATGKMYASRIGKQGVKWQGDVAEVNVGFNLEAPGGYHSIFIMYGTPRISKDSAVFNAIKGSATKKEIERIQNEVLEKYLSLVKGG